MHQVEKTLAAHGDKLNSVDKDEAQAALSATRSAASGSSLDGLTKSTERLAQASKKINDVVAQAGTAGSNADEKPTAQQSSGKPEEHVIDAEFEDVSAS